MTNEVVNAGNFDNIFNDAILFFICFAILSIISLVVSKKSAKKYERENPLQERKDVARKDKLFERYINASMVKVKGKDIILAELSKLLQNKTIDEEEFQILKSTLDDI